MDACNPDIEGAFNITAKRFGASFGGVSALLTMLNSCATGVATVNIDNGFGAGCIAHRINLLGETEGA